MDFDSLRDYCLSLPGATEEIQWGTDLLFKVGGKTFVFAGMNPPHGLSIKCSPDDIALLIEREGIIPAPYLAKHSWVHIESLTTLGARELKERIMRSYELIRGKLPKTVQMKLSSSS